jgi:predicted RNA binding protein YcfA (HicA-like mRNA interferase family)
MERWLERNNFARKPGRHGHLQFEHAPTGVKVTIQGHGPQVLSKPMKAKLLRQLEGIGFDRNQLAQEV